MGKTKDGKTKKGKVDQRTKNRRAKTGGDVAHIKDERIAHLMSLISTGQYIPHVTPRELQVEWKVTSVAYVEHCASEAARALRLIHTQTPMLVAGTLATLQTIVGLAIASGDYGSAIKALLAKQGMVERVIALGWDKDAIETTAEEKEDEREITLAAILPHRLAAEANERGDAPETVEAPEAAPAPPVNTTPEKPPEKP